MNRRQRREEAALGQPVHSGPPCGRVEHASFFERVGIRRVVIHAGSRARHAGPDTDVTLGGMEIAARRVDAQRPSRRARLLPGREAEAVAEEHGDARQPGGDHRPRMNRGEQFVVGHVPPRGAALRSGRTRRTQRLLEADSPAVVERPEGFGLRRPVQVAEGAGVTAEVMLGLVVVVADDRQRAAGGHGGG